MAKTKRKPDPGVVLNLPITPFLDFSFQLMFFFITTFKPMKPEGSLDFTLPAEGGGAPSDPTAIPDEKEEYKIIVRSSAGGREIGVIDFKSPTATQPFAGADRLDQIESKLKSLSKPTEGSKKGAVVSVEADGDLKYGRVVEVMDRCRQAGFTNVGVNILKEKGPIAGGDAPPP